MNKQEFNKRCAEYMGYEIKIFLQGVGVWNDKKGNWKPLFDPYSDANDRNKVIEKMGITIFRTIDKTWNCYLGNINAYAESLEQAQINCIEKVLDDV